LGVRSNITSIAVVASSESVFAEVIKRAGRRLGTVLAEAVAILDPELVLLGGETLQLLGDSFVETMVLEIRKSAMPINSTAISFRACKCSTTVPEK
jgi:predicted NBD/HSP70 family sugar kinase